MPCSRAHCFKFMEVDCSVWTRQLLSTPSTRGCPSGRSRSGPPGPRPPLAAASATGAGRPRSCSDGRAPAARRAGHQSRTPRSRSARTRRRAVSLTLHALHPSNPAGSAVLSHDLGSTVARNAPRQLCTTLPPARSPHQAQGGFRPRCGPAVPLLHLLHQLADESDSPSRGDPRLARCIGIGDMGSQLGRTAHSPSPTPTPDHEQRGHPQEVRRPGPRAPEEVGHLIPDAPGEPQADAVVAPGHTVRRTLSPTSGEASAAPTGAQGLPVPRSDGALTRVAGPGQPPPSLSTEAPGRDKGGLATITYRARTARPAFNREEGP